ncbi:MAG TPA: response regulator transcription factor [Acidimicrobiales bacterium]|nr:response regulator transcription factor [Acidimicrobiales bacterium]
MVTYTVVIVDDDPEIRALLAVLVGAERNFTVVGEAANGADGIDLVARTRPDLVILDLNMPGTDGLSALPRLRAVSPRTSVVMLTGNEDPTIQVAAIRGGVSAFLSKGAALPDRLVAVLREVVAEPVIRLDLAESKTPAH